jgi:formylglycine-generating enzyme required for sulfatase activity
MKTWAFSLCLLILASGALAQDQLAREFRECPECPEMVGMPAGRFVMGSPVNEAGRFESEGPQRIVSVKAFALAKYPVSSREFLTFLRATGHRPAPCNPALGLGWKIPGRGLANAPHDQEPPDWPAVCLDWRDARAYVAWINAKARAANPRLIQGPYRLPSEAEWEYAARAGTNTARWWGNDIGSNNANCNGCGSPYDRKLLAPVHAFKPNPYGLYGMLGNAWQWVEDCWHPTYAGAPTDGGVWAGGDCSRHVLRGGSWSNLPAFVRAATRSAAANNSDDSSVFSDYSSMAGFRLARDLP